MEGCMEGDKLSMCCFAYLLFSGLSSAACLPQVYMQWLDSKQCDWLRGAGSRGCQVQPWPLWHLAHSHWMALQTAHFSVPGALDVCLISCAGTMTSCTIQGHALPLTLNLKLVSM